MAERRKQVRMSKKASKILFEIICEDSFQGKSIKTILPATRRIAKAKEKLWEYIRGELLRRSDEEYDLPTISNTWYYQMRKIGTCLDQIDEAEGESVRLKKLKTMERYVCDQMGEGRLRKQGKKTRDEPAEVKLTATQMVALSRNTTMETAVHHATNEDAAPVNSQPVKNERESSNDDKQKEKEPIEREERDDERMEEEEMREDGGIENDVHDHADVLENRRGEANDGIPSDEEPLSEVAARLNRRSPFPSRHNTMPSDGSQVSRYNTHAGMPSDGSPVVSRFNTHDMPYGRPLPSRYNTSVDGPPLASRFNTLAGITMDGAAFPTRFNTLAGVHWAGAALPTRNNTSVGIPPNGPLPAHFNTPLALPLDHPSFVSRQNTEMPLDRPPLDSRFNTPEEMSVDGRPVPSRYNTPDTTLISRNNSTQSVSGYDADNEKGIIKRRRKGLKRRIIKIEEEGIEDEGEEGEEGEGEMDNDDEKVEDDEEGLEDEEKENEVDEEGEEGRGQRMEMIGNLRGMIRNLRDHVVSLRVIGAIDAGDMQTLAEAFDNAGKSISNEE